MCKIIWWLLACRDNLLITPEFPVRLVLDEFQNEGLKFSQPFILVTIAILIPKKKKTLIKNN